MDTLKDSYRELLAFLKKSDEMFQAAAKEPQKVQASASDANAAARRRRRPPVTATGDEDAEPPPAPAFPAGKMTPWQAYAQALLSSGEFYYVN